METLREILQPVTHNLPAPLADVGRELITPVCYKRLVLDIDPFGAPDCLKLAVSKGLSIGIIGASAIVKIPQLLKILNSQSAAGVSFLSYLLESGAYLISLSYNIRHKFPFSTYGETALILAQNIAIASSGLAAAGTVLFREDIVDFKTLAWLQAASGVLGVASKVPQIATIWREGGTGQLSAFAVGSDIACDCCTC